MHQPLDKFEPPAEKFIFLKAFFRADCIAYSNLKSFF